MNRRALLVLAAGVCAAAGGVACGGDGDGGEPLREEEQVPLSMIPIGSAYTPEVSGCSGRSGSFILARDASGVYAYTNTCTHAGGAVPVPDADGVSRCCLHGSRYDRNGDLIEGVVPDQKNLRHLVVRIEGTGSAAVVVVSLLQEEPDRGRRIPVPT